MSFWNEAERSDRIHLFFALPPEILSPIALRAPGSRMTQEAFSTDTKYGQEQHKFYKLGQADGINTRKEFRFDNGLRADFIDIVNKIVYELKPDNARAINQGAKQLERYVEQANKQYGEGFRGILETYKSLK